MEILHICSYYVGRPFYRNLIEKLDEVGNKQQVYIPIKTKNLVDKYKSKTVKQTDYIYSDCYNNMDRFLYNIKIKKTLNDVYEKVNLENVQLIHAHSLYANGAIAYKIKKEKNIDYIVAVRNTDVNLFLKYRVNLRKLGINILEEAKKIIFLSPAYKDYVINKYVPYNLRSDFMKKSIVIPNGIDNFWIHNIASEPKKIKTNKDINLIYVGELNRNKNIMKSVKAVIKLKDRGYNPKFTIIGYGKYLSKLKKIQERSYDVLDVCGEIRDKQLLLEKYNSADIFIMPSINETFGLTYIEAMSQGLPVVYSKGQGIDGYFNEQEVGISVNPRNIDDITSSVERIVKQQDKMSKKCLMHAKEFSWDKIAAVYNSLYTLKD